MSVVIRLRKLGTKKTPHFRICVCDSRRSRDGSFIEEIGYYDPSKEPAYLKIDKAKAERWIKLGAKPSGVVKNILKRQAAAV